MTTSSIPKPLFVSPIPDYVPGAWFDTAAVERFLEFSSKCRHIKGKWAGSPFEWEPWQIEYYVAPVFGWKHPDGTRIIKTVYIEEPRKNGKTTAASVTALYLLSADREPGAEVVAGATKKDQAKQCFDPAAKMVEASKPLSKRLTVYKGAIVYQATDSVFKVITADAKYEQGLNIHGAIIDELHAHSNRDFLDVIETATGSREQPLIVIITTSGTEESTVCWEKHEYARKCAEKVIQDPTFWGVIYAAEETDDWTDEKTWEKANPNIDISIRRDYLRQMCKRAQDTPAAENAFKRYHLNIWTKQVTRWIPLIAWDKCVGIVDETKLKGRLCYGGLDLSSTTDLTAFIKLFPPEREDELLKVVCRFWMPEDRVAELVKTGINYDVWVRDGFIKATPGNVVDYRIVRNDILQDNQDYLLKEVAYDKWGATQMSQDLADEGIEMVEMGQGYANLSGPSKEFERLVLGAKLNHGGNPVLRWMIDCVTAKQDPAGNIKPVKPDRRTSAQRIDGVVGLIMALDRAIRHEKTADVWSSQW